VLCQTCVLDPVESAGYVVHSDALGAQNVNALFFMLSWDWYEFHKMRFWTSYVEHVYSHLGGSAGHMVHSGASGA
jgi:hypothetical protein